MAENNSKENIDAIYCFDTECPNKSLKCLLTHAAESTEEFSKIFHDLLCLQAQLHQITKFFVKLLRSVVECIQENSAGKLVQKGKIPVIVLNRLAIVFQQLPYGQTIELWKIFAETYSDFVNISDVFPHGKGAVYFLAQLFSSFLLHSNILDPIIPNSIFAKFEELQKFTAKELKKSASVLSSTEKGIRLLKKSFLVVCFSLGEVKLALYSASENSQKYFPKLDLPIHCLNLSLVHELLNEDHATIFETLLNDEDKTISFFTFQLLLQKMKGFFLYEELTDNELTHLKECISFALHHFKSSSCFEKLWDLDVSTLKSSNYGSAMLVVLLKHFPVMLKYIENKELLDFCKTFADVLMEFNACEYNNVEELSVLNILDNELFQESKHLQTALVAALWQMDNKLINKKRSREEMDSEKNYADVLHRLSIFQSKWFKYIGTTPKSKNGDGLNSLWANVKDTCSFFNELLQKRDITRPKINSQVYNITKIISQLPLEHLLSVNQMQILIGLSVMFFAIPESIPCEQQCKIAEEISIIMTSIFKGVHSIWLFDFVKNGPYLKETVNTIQKIALVTENIYKMEWPKLLLESIIILSAKSVETLTSLETSFSEIIENGSSESSLLVLGMTLEKLSQISHLIKLKPGLKEISERMFPVACSVCITRLEDWERNSSDTLSTLIIWSYTELLDTLCSGTFHVENKMIEKCLKPLIKVIDTVRNHLSIKEIPLKSSGLYVKFLSKICTYRERLSIFIPENLISLVWKSIHLKFQDAPHNIYDQNSLRQVIAFEEPEVDLLHSLFPTLSQQEIDNIFQEILKQLETNDYSSLNAYTLQTNLCILKELIGILGKTSKKELQIPNDIFLQLLSSLHCIISQSEKTEDVIFNVKVPALCFIASVVKLCKDSLSRQCLIQCFYPCTAVNLLDINDMKQFTQTHSAVWNIVYNLLVDNHEIVLSVSAAFLSIVIMLLKSLVTYGSQDRMLQCDKETQQQMYYCAQNIERLLTIIARHKTEFSKLVPYVIADYVDCVQHITLEATIKGHLLSGLNRILDLVSEDSLKMLAVNINHSCRDIYSNIVKNYKKYRYHGAV